MSHVRTRLAVGLLATLVATIAWAGTATAYDGDVEPSGSISLTSSGNVTLRAGINVECPLTLGGRIREGPIAISEGTAGEVNTATIGTCSGGTITAALLGTPWTITAESSQGTLPEGDTSITLTMQNVGLSGLFLGVTCLYGGTIKGQLALSGNTYYEAGALRMDETSRLRKVSGGAFCAETAALAGSMRIGAATHVLVCTEACRLADITKGRFEPEERVGHDFGRVATNATINYNFEFKSRTGWRINTIRLSNSTDFSVTGLTAGETLAAQNYPLRATFRTRGIAGQPYITDYMLLMEPRDGNVYFYVFIMFGRT